MTLRTALLIMTAWLPSLALAVDELSYSYVEGIYTTGEVDRSGADVDFEQIGGIASYELTENFALVATGKTGEIQTTDIGAPRDIDTRELSLGLTAHFPLFDNALENVDLVVPVAINYARARAGSITGSDTGYSVAVGVRALLTERIEVEGAIQHIDIDGNDNQSLIGGARFHFTDAISVGVSGQLSDDVTSAGVSGRYSF